MKNWNKVIIYENYLIVLLLFLRKWAQMGLFYRLFIIVSLSINDNLLIGLWLAGLFIMAIKFSWLVKRSKTKITYHIMLVSSCKVLPSTSVSIISHFHTLVSQKKDLIFSQLYIGQRHRSPLGVDSGMSSSCKQGPLGVGIDVFEFKHFSFLLQQFEQTHRKSMETIEQSHEPKKYSKYTREMRLELIRMVDEERISTAQAGRLLGIKQTSACRIMRSYHHHHRIFERKTDRLNRQRREAVSSSQKDISLSNKITQQKIQVQKEQSSLSLEGLKSQQGVSCHPLSTENGEGSEVNLSGVEKGTFFQPILNIDASCYPIYYSGLVPFTYGYFL